jgi:YHS domain-containing protein
MKNIRNLIPLPSAVVSAGRFVLHFGEMVVAMGLGMVVLDVALGVVPAASAALGDHAGLLYQVVMAVAMTLPMIGWMFLRGHGWQHGIEMSLGMVLPWAAVLALVAMGATNVLPWLAVADGPAMLLGMLVVMLLRPGHYAHGHHKAHGQSTSGPADPVCGMPIDPRTATRTAEFGGQTYYFCAPGCRKSFLAEPARFLAADYAPSM